MKNAKSEDFLQGNCKIAYNRSVSKYALHTASSLLKLKSKFYNSNLELMKKNTRSASSISMSCEFEGTHLDKKVVKVMRIL